MTHEPASPSGTPPLDADARAKTEAALARLGAVLTDLATRVTEHVHERCPYRARDDRCTFAGGCRNQRRGVPAADVARAVWCGGDHQLRRGSE
jgi:hypothetical protein